MDYNVYKVQNSINHMLNPSEDRDVNNIYQLSTEKARNWWNMQGFESRKNIVIESDAVINDDKLVEDQTIADIADKDYDDLPDVTKQEVELQVEDEENMEELFEVEDEEYLKCGICGMSFTTNEDYDIHRSVDHGEEPEDLEESEETYQLTMHPELTRESLREANDLLRETKPTQLYSGYDKNGDVQSSIMPYNVPSVATGKYNDNPNSFFYSNKIFRAGDSALRTSSLGEALTPSNGVSFEYIDSVWNQYFEQAGTDNNHVGWLDFAQSKGVNGGDAENKWNDENYTSYGFHSESKASESINTVCPECGSKNTSRQQTKFGGGQAPERFDCKKCGNVFKPKSTESKANENFMEEINKWEGFYNDVLSGNRTGVIDQVERDGGDSFMFQDPDTPNSWVLDQIQMTLDDLGGQQTDWQKNEDNNKYNDMYYNPNQPYPTGESFDVEATEKGEWDWLDKGADSKSVDYDEVKYGDDGVSDISIQNTEPKGADANEFLDNIYIGVESVDYVYPTKASEAMEKTYIPVSETFEEDYEEFEDSDEVMIKETITLRKLTGYGDDAIARELHINYGVSHEEALEKVYSVEVSTNDRVSQTFFGKMYRECTESEKDELQMYSGSD
jgi:uncharacterized C2H2 Zn-finger protein